MNLQFKDYHKWPELRVYILIVATQRPSVDVITGTIKSNFPTRISYKVVNKINSRTILEEQGAEQLLGQGDLLITMLGDQLLRVHGPYVKTEEVIAVVNHLKSQGEPEYLDSVTNDDEDTQSISLGFNESGDDLYDKAVSIVCREKKASTSFIQRHLQIGYNRAARIIENGVRRNSESSKSCWKKRGSCWQR